MPKASGVYAIINRIDGKQYIGSAVSLVARWDKHRSTLRAAIHRNIKLQRAWNKYGEAAFEFRKLLICAPKELLFYEQRCIDGYKPEYNLFPTAGSAFGYKHSPESLAKLGARRRGTKHTAETLAKISASNTGKKRTPEQRAKLSLKRLSPEHKAALLAAATGRIKSPETRAKLSKALKGRKLSPEQVEKTAAKLRGRKLAAAHIAKVVAANTGKKRSPGFSETMSRALKGRTFSDEWRAKLSAAAKRPRSEKQVQHIANLAAAKTGKPGYRPTDEVRAKIAATLSGRKQSADLIEKRIAPLRGRTRSDEVRAKIASAQTAAWARGRIDRKGQAEEPDDAPFDPARMSAYATARLAEIKAEIADQ